MKAVVEKREAETSDAARLKPCPTYQAGAGERAV
jgi:hypothetical protein